MSAPDWTLLVLGRLGQTRSRALPRCSFPCDVLTAGRTSAVAGTHPEPEPKSKNQGVPWGNLISYVDYTLFVGCQYDSTTEQVISLDQTAGFSN